MQGRQNRIEKSLVLVGGGHAHVQVVKSFGMKPEHGVRLTLISPDPVTPYSGMLPGLIAGHYTFDESHIDLIRLCRWAGARFVQGEAEGIDLARNRLRLKNRPDTGYDVVSIDTGSTPQANDVPGAAEFAIPVKPISRFLAHWHALRERALSQEDIMRIAVVGAGAGGVELLLSAQHALEQIRQDAGIRTRAEFHLFSRGEIMPAEAPLLRATFRRILQERSVHLHEGETITKVERGLLRTANGGRFGTDHILWVTAAGAPAWPAVSGLATDENGFIAVLPTLRSTSHQNVFAAGDVAAMVESPRPKAGVFAVRQGPYLARNLRNALRGAALETYRPQDKFLKIVSTGRRHAVASRGNWTLAGDWVWRWKDSIDRRFMSRFNDLADMDAPPSILSRLGAALAPPPREDMRCGGCGAKIGDELLKRALSELKPVAREDVLIGLDAPDDAAALRVPDGKISIHTVDAFRAMIEDPYVFGKIAANHALGDIYAMRAAPQSALAVVTLPADAGAIVEDDLAQMMNGAVEVLNAAGASLVGGHTAEGMELSLGFALTGIADPARLWRKGGLKDGNALILTKPLGTGALLAADMRAKAKGRDVAAAIASMLQSQAEAARILAGHDARACTDVTGFGLAGHLLEMLRASNVSAKLDISALRLLPGALDAMGAGYFSTLHPENFKCRRFIDGIAPDILFDPQTAGPLLAGVPRERASDCIAALHAAGYEQAALIGEIAASAAGEVQIITK